MFGFFVSPRWAMLAIASGFGCAEGADACGPARGLVARVIDGDTVELAGGERVRYLLVDTPELGSAKNACFAAEALLENRSLVEARMVELRYGPRCRDRYDRLLAYATVDGVDVNEALVKSGHACVLHIPPDGDDRVGAFRGYERAAQAGKVGLWGACASKPCGD